MEKVSLPRERVFLVHGNVPHSGGGSKANYRLRYDLDLIPENVDLNDAVVFAYGHTTQCKIRNKREALLGDVDPLYRSQEKESGDNNASRSTINVDMTGGWDKNSALGLRPDNSIDAPFDED